MEKVSASVEVVPSRGSACVSWQYRKGGGEMRHNWVEKERKTNADGKEIVVMETSLIIRTELPASVSEERREKILTFHVWNTLMLEAAKVYEQVGNLHDFAHNVFDQEAAGAVI